MKSGRLVVRHHAPWQRRIWFSVLSLVLLGAGWGLFYFGQGQAGFNTLRANDTEIRLKGAIASLEEEKVALRDQIALLERSTQMDKQAYSEVDTNLKNLQEEILELREEVSFYRGIVAPLESSAGLRIEKLRIESAGEERLFHFKLVVTQVLKNDRVVTGRADIIIDGLEDGAPKKYTLKDVGVAGKKALDLNFRYFQKFEGDILVPAGFTPRAVEVRVNPKRNKVIKSTYEWDSLIGGSETPVVQSETSDET